MGERVESVFVLRVLVLGEEEVYPRMPRMGGEKKEE
jgi:hypothetical protein